LNTRESVIAFLQVDENVIQLDVFNSY
jgi:hypothetical protein